MRNLVTLNNIKTWMNAEGTSGNDAFYATLQAAVSRAIEKYCERKFISRYYSEIYDGNGRASMLLKNYPVYLNGSNFSLYIDSDREFAAASLEDSDNYHVSEDSGVMVYFGGTFPEGSKIITVQYWAGYSRFEVLADTNDYLDVTDSGGTVAIQITAGTYIAETLASTLEDLLNADATLTGTYTVTYRHDTQKFTIACDETFSLLWNTGDNAAKTAGTLLGFTVTADDESAATYTADNPVTGLPEDISLAAQKIIHAWFSDSAKGADLQTVKSRNVGADATVEYDKQDLPREVKLILDHYKIWS